MKNLSLGSLTSAEPSQLAQCSLEELATQILRSESLQTETNKIRQLRGLDSGAFEKAKTRLPYFCWNRFENNQRKTDYFESSEAFCFDIDDYSNDIEALRELEAEIFKEPSVCLVFVSPSGKGLKILMAIEPEIVQASVYKAYYKAVAEWLCDRYGLTGFLDSVTHDPARICFLSHDPQALYRDNPQPFNLNLLNDGLPWYSPNETEVLGDETPNAGASPKMEVLLHEPHSPAFSKPPQEMPYEEILRRLKPGKSPIPQFAPVVPATVLDVLPPIKHRLLEFDILISDQKPIQYGISLEFSAPDGSKGFLNIYHGKNGYSIVPQGKKGHNPAMNEAMFALVTDVIRTHAQKDDQSGGALTAVL